MTTFTLNGFTRNLDYDTGVYSDFGPSVIEIIRPDGDTDLSYYYDWISYPTDGSSPLPFARVTAGNNYATLLDGLEIGDPPAGTPTPHLEIMFQDVSWGAGMQTQMLHIFDVFAGVEYYYELGGDAFPPITDLASLDAFVSSFTFVDYILDGPLSHGTNIDLNSLACVTTSEDDLINVLEDAGAIRSGLGNDTINGLATEDNIFAGLGDDQVSTGDGNDYINGGGGNDLLNGGGGDHNTIMGAAGNDTLIGGGNFGDTLHGGAGNDSIVAGNGSSNMLFGGAGADTVETGTQWNAVWAGSGDDLLIGNSGMDQMDGGADNDTLIGAGGDDSLAGGHGDDEINGQFGADTLDGGAGNDTLLSGSANDSINGGLGNDTINASTGLDTVHGGAGNDSMRGGAQDDQLNGDAGMDLLIGDVGNDVLDGGTGNDTLNGGANADILVGGAGDDLLRGQDGADTLSGYDGNDTLIGGTHADRFVFELGGEADVISDFQNNLDEIQFSELLWTGTLTAQQVVDTYATVIADNAVFDFGGGDVLTVNGIVNEQFLVNDISFF